MWERAGADFRYCFRNSRSTAVNPWPLAVQTTHWTFSASKNPSWCHFLISWSFNWRIQHSVGLFSKFSSALFWALTNLWILWWSLWQNMMKLNGFLYWKISNMLTCEYNRIIFNSQKIYVSKPTFNRSQDVGGYNSKRYFSKTRIIGIKTISNRRLLINTVYIIHIGWAQLICFATNNWI